MTLLQWVYDHWLFSLLAIFTIGSILEDLIVAWKGKKNEYSQED